MWNANKVVAYGSVRGTYVDVNAQCILGSFNICGMTNINMSLKYTKTCTLLFVEVAQAPKIHSTLAHAKFSILLSIVHV